MFSSEDYSSFAYLNEAASGFSFKNLTSWLKWKWRIFSNCWSRKCTATLNGQHVFMDFVRKPFQIRNITFLYLKWIGNKKLKHFRKRLTIALDFSQWKSAWSNEKLWNILKTVGILFKLCRLVSLPALYHISDLK